MNSEGGENLCQFLPQNEILAPFKQKIPTITLVAFT